MQLAIAAAVICILCALAERAETHTHNQPFISYRQPHLSVEADHIPMGLLLEQIARNTGVNIVLKGPADQPVSVSFKAIPLDQAIRRLFAGANIALTYKSNSDGKSNRLTDVLVVMDAGSAATVFSNSPDSPAQRDVSETGEDENPAESGGLPEVPSISEIETKFFTEQNPRTRADLIQLMMNIPGDEIESATKLLMIAVKDDHIDVRVAALTALSAMPEEMAAGGMLEAMNDPEPDVRAAAVMIVGSLPLISPIDLLDLGLKDTDTRVRVVSIEKVAEMENPSVLPLLAAATKDADPSVREAALQAIAQLEENADSEANNIDVAIGLPDGDPGETAPGGEESSLSGSLIPIPSDAQ